MSKFVKELFDKLANLGEYYGTARPVKVNIKKIIQDIELNTKFKKKEKVLDYGCGSGLLSIEISKKVNSVVSADISVNSLDMLAKKIKKKKINNIQIYDLNSNDLKSYKNYFDKVILYAVLHYLDKRKQHKFLNKIINLTKKGGEILLYELPDKKIIQKFQSRNKTTEEIKILEKFNNQRVEYDKLFNENIDKKFKDLILKKSFFVDIESVKSFFLKKGHNVYLYEQSKNLPFSLSRLNMRILLKNK